MKWKRTKKWLLWISCLLLLLAAVFYFLMDYAVDYALRTIADSAIEQVLSEGNAGKQSENAEPVEAHSHSKSQSDAMTPDEPSPGGSSDAVPKSDDAAAQNAQSQSGTVKANEQSNLPAKQTPSSNGKGSSSVVADQNTDQSNSLNEPYSGEVTIEKAEQAEQKISLKDKTKVTTTLLRSLSKNDIATLAGLAEGGLTISEKRQAKQLILERLSAEEYDELIQIAAKLGLSQGKTYAESLKTVNK